MSRRSSLSRRGGRTPPPAGVWAIMDDSRKRLIGSHGEFARRIRRECHRSRSGRCETSGLFIPRACASTGWGG